MNEEKISHINYTIESSKNLINPTLLTFLFYLFKYIFLHESKSRKSYNAVKKLESWIKTVNEQIIKNTNNFISSDYTKENLKNIIKFVKSQNILYSSDIIENIMIILFSLAFKTTKENTFAKYIYNNLLRIKQPKNSDFADWFDNMKFKQEEFNDFKKLLIEAPLIKDINDNKPLSKLQKDNVFYYFLIELYKDKNIYYENEFKNKIKYYQEINKEKINDKNKDDETYFITDKITKEEEDSFYQSISINEYRQGKLDHTQNLSITITKSFFISVYIYYQNKNSPLMKYINPSENDELAIMPFAYDFSSGVIRSEFAGAIMASARIEPRIHTIDMSKNILKEKGLIELAKILLFNKNIKIIDFHREAIKSIYLDYFYYGLNIFDNNSIEELNISCNLIRDDCNYILGKILCHLKGLKTINLSMNNLGRGITYFFIVLKNLYRRNKIKLENLYLNDCNLDESSFYELGRLLNCKFCKLKNLYLNRNNIPSNIKFLKKLKQNKSLTEIYFNSCNIGNEQTESILRIISNTNLQCLYLYNNKFTNFKNALRIIYRTKLINIKNGINEKNQNKMYRDDSLLYNLDLSKIDIFPKNKKYIKLLDKIIDETTLYCLDFSHILLGKELNNPGNKFIESEYQKEVYSLRDKLNEDQKYYMEIIENINSNEISNEKLNNYKNIELNEKIMKEIDEILLDKNCIYPIFLKIKAKEIRNNNEIFFEGKNKKEIKENLMKYMQCKLSNQKLKKLREKKNQRKLIII